MFLHCNAQAAALVSSFLLGNRSAIAKRGWVLALEVTFYFAAGTEQNRRFFPNKALGLFAALVLTGSRRYSARLFVKAASRP